MDSVLTEDSVLKTREDYIVAIDHCLAEMARLHAHMVNDQAEIDQLQAETRALLATMQTP